MGKVKRKQRVAETFGSPMSAPPASSPNHSSASASVSSPPKSVSPSARSSTSSLSSCSSSTSSSLSSPLSTSPSPNWPLSTTPSQLTNSVSSYTLLDEDSGLGGSSDISSAYSPLKVARFNQSPSSCSASLSPSSSAGAHHDMLHVKAPFSKRTPSAIPPASHHHLHHAHHHHSHFLSPSPLGFPSVSAMSSPSVASAAQCFANSVVPSASGTLQPRNSSPNRPNLLVQPMRKPSGGGSQNSGQNNCSANSKMAHGAYSSRSKNGKYELKILSQPEEQHRARYLTEGSRGAIKDKSGHGYPVVKLCGYSRQPVKIQCFIGHDKQIGTPHLFYQASKIAGKNSTACFIKKVEGTSVIVMEAQPANNMEINVDCIGILKERNVDVEQKLNKFQRLGPASSDADVQSVANIKRSTRCRLVFRCEIAESSEILQAVSAPILCTQPLGTPEINKKSLTQCDINGGTELFIIGKNFLKDAKVIFRNEKWIKIVEPNREYLKSTHLICTVPSYDAPVQKATHHCRKTSPPPAPGQPQVIEVNLMVKSGGKCSDPHKFFYTVGGPHLAEASAVSTEAGDAVSNYSHDSAKLLDTLLEASNHSNDAFVNHYQHQFETKEAISRSVEAGNVTSSQAADMIGASLSQHIASELVANASAEAHDQNGGVVCGPSVGNSVLAAAAVVAANEVQALSDSNQLTAANLHQTVTTAAAVAVAATEAVLADNSNSAGGPEAQSSLTAIPGPPNQATVAVVAAQINSMIPYLTLSDTATALSVAASVKQESMAESELAGASPPQQAQSGAPMSAPQSSYMNAAMMSNCSPEAAENKSYMSGYSPSNANAAIESNNASIQSMMCTPQDLSQHLKSNEMAAVPSQMNVMMSPSSVLNPYAGEQASSQLPMSSMETNQMSFANLNHDPMSTLKVDTLTLHDKVPLPQLSLSDITKQLAMPSVATPPTNMNMVPIDTVMSEKPLIFASEVTNTLSSQSQIQAVDAIVNGSMVQMVPSPEKSPNVSSLSNVSSLLEQQQQQASPTVNPGPSVIMSPPSYNIVSPESKCSNGLIVGNFSSIKSTMVNIPQGEYMSQSGLVSDLKSNLSPVGMISAMGPVSTMSSPSQVTSSVLAGEKVGLTANTIESFIQNMNNHESLSSPENLSMLSTALTASSNSTPTYESLIAQNNPMMLTAAVQPQPQNVTGVITTGPAAGAVPPTNNSVMMDTLPSTLTTQNGVILSVSNTGTPASHSVISSLGHSVESVTLPGLRGPVQFTDNVEMAPVSSGQSSMIISSQSQAQTSSTVSNLMSSEANKEASQVPVQPTSTVLANHQLVSGQLVHQPQTSNICTMSTMTDAELISFINPATFE